jgi:hypothetical protein
MVGKSKRCQVIRQCWIQHLQGHEGEHFSLLYDFGTLCLDFINAAYDTVERYHNRSNIVELDVCLPVVRYSCGCVVSEALF